MHWQSTAEGWRKKESLEREIEQGNREKVRLTEEKEKFKAAGLNCQKRKR